MGGIGNIAMAAAAIAVASIAYAIFQQVWTLIPWAGSAMMGASWALMFSGIDPILGMGGAIGLGAFIYPALQIFTAHTTRTYRNPMAMPTANNAVKSLRTTGAIMATGIVAGVGHLVTKNVPGSLIAGAAAGYLMSKYGSSALINFYIETIFVFIVNIFIKFFYCSNGIHNIHKNFIGNINFRFQDGRFFFHITLL